MILLKLLHFDLNKKKLHISLQIIAVIFTQICDFQWNITQNNYEIESVEVFFMFKSFYIQFKSYNL